MNINNELELILSSNLTLYLLFILLAYLLYELLSGKIPNKWKAFLLGKSLIILIATLLGGVFVSDVNLKQGLFTFSSVYLGFWLNEQTKVQEERRKLKFFLGILWQELRYNRTLIETLKENYIFYMDQGENIEIMYLKFSGINSHAGFIKSTVYDSFVSSSIITALKKDDVFNDLATAYTNMKFLQTAFGIIQTDFDIKLKIHQYSIAKNGKDDYVEEIMKDLGSKIQNTGAKEVAISFRSVVKAIESIDAYLKSMGVNPNEEEPSDAILNEDDRKFIEAVLQKSPSVLPTNLFKE